MEKRLNLIEIGIASCHMWIAALHFNKKIEFLVLDKSSLKIPEGYFYTISGKITEVI